MSMVPPRPSFNEFMRLRMPTLCTSQQDPTGIRRYINQRCKPVMKLRFEENAIKSGQNPAKALHSRSPTLSPVGVQRDSLSAGSGGSMESVHRSGIALTVRYANSFHGTPSAPVNERRSSI